jgi:hypothetical protein
MSYNERLANAIAYLTGGSVRLHVHNNTVWSKVAETLQKEGIDPEDYCYFISHHSTNQKNTALLVQANRLNSASTIEQYRKHKKEVKGYVPTTIRTQTYCFDSRGAAGMDPTELLLDPLMSFDPIMRIELALRNEDKMQIDTKAILDKYKHKAEYMLYGYPEYKEHCRKTVDRLRGVSNGNGNNG